MSADAGRKAEVLARLQAAFATGEWVDGTALANAEVGGSEGLKRLRELRSDGWQIEMRRHPDPDRTVRQYRLTPGTFSPARVDANTMTSRMGDTDPRPPEPKAPRSQCCNAPVHVTPSMFDARIGEGRCPNCRKPVQVRL